MWAQKEWRISTVRNFIGTPNIIRMIKSIRFRWAGYVARMEEGRSAFKMLSGKPTGKRPLGSPWRRREDSDGIYILKNSY